MTLAERLKKISVWIWKKIGQIVTWALFGLIAAVFIAAVVFTKEEPQK